MVTLTAASPNYRRELRGGLIQRWSTPEDIENIAQLCGMVFLQLLFGYRSLDELRYAFPDVRVENSRAELLLCALFPKKYSWVPG